MAFTQCFFAVLSFCVVAHGFASILDRPVQNGFPLVPTRLRVDHAYLSRGINTQQPKFTWALQHTGRSQRPRSYEIEVKRKLSNGTFERAWSINTSVPDENFGQPISYNSDGNGQKLISDTDYVWRVRWQDANMLVSSWADWSKFTTAILQESDWYGAEWIGMDGPSNVAPFVDLDEANRFRTELSINTTQNKNNIPVRCSLIISGLGYYRATLQGMLLDDHELGESTQFQNRIPYDNVDCSSVLSAVIKEEISSGFETKNGVQIALGVELGRGWYGEQRIQALGNIPSGPRMLRCLLTITYSDGTIQHLSSKPDTFLWRRGRGPIVWDQLHLGIVYDSRRETPGWDKAGFDDSHWKVIEKPLNLSDMTSNVGYGRLSDSKLTTRLHPRIRKIKIVKPVSVSSVGTSGYLVDLGENIAGWCKYNLHPRPNMEGENVTFSHAEYLSTDGTITHNIQPLTIGAYEQTVFILPAYTNSSVSFEPRFVSYGFRYVQLNGPLMVAPSINDITCWWVHTDLEQTGHFSFLEPSRDKVLENVLVHNFNATLDSARSNFISYPTDCPHRERRGWLGDAGAASHTLSSAFDMSAAYTKWLQDISDTALLEFSNGNIGSIAPQYASPCSGPAQTPKTQGKDAPAWSAAFVIIWDQTWRQYGDIGLASRHYDQAKAYVDFLGKSWDPVNQILPVDWGGNLLGDWCAALGVNNTGNPGPYQNSYFPQHTSGAFNTFYFIKTHEAVIEAQIALGKPKSEIDPVKNRLLAAKNGFNKMFFDDLHSIYRDKKVALNMSTYGPEPLQTVLSLALELGLPDLINRTAEVEASLSHDIRVRGSRMTSGLIGLKYLFSNLASIRNTTGRAGIDAALDILNGSYSPSYRYMFAQGPGNTLWESPNGNATYHRPRGSLNHIMLGGHAGPFFFGKLAGILLPKGLPNIGWQSFTVSPTLTRSISGFSAEIQTWRGPIRSTWHWLMHSQDKAYTLNITVPVGATASIHFQDCATVEESGNIVWQHGHFIPYQGNGIVSAVLDEAINGIKLVTASGDYKFVASQI